MKKSNFLTGSLKPISRNELRKIAGGSGPCTSCSLVFTDPGTGFCSFMDQGELCLGRLLFVAPGSNEKICCPL
ncbi:hypothetical protein [Ascidiimonas aurantiaca]|uniref:hypothetical protein n=1 Tax=Ascidiimonas aurantiaca TaxID=1685432 RepID=UPI0030EEB9E3